MTDGNEYSQFIKRQPDPNFSGVNHFVRPVEQPMVTESFHKSECESFFQVGVLVGMLLAAFVFLTPLFVFALIYSGK